MILGEVDPRGDGEAQGAVVPRRLDDLVLDSRDPEIARVGVALAREHERAEAPLDRLRE